jgi:uncharacterized protein
MSPASGRSRTWRIRRGRRGTPISALTAWMRPPSAQAAGASVLVSPIDALPAGRLAVLVDPVGAVVSVWEARAREGAQFINEPGTWTMSSLHTADGEGAKAFYGAVFGWQPEAVGSAEAQMTLWRMPGYEGGEGKWATVPSDVVAVMAPTGAAATAVPPHWNVNLCVEDADATVEGAVGLGGEVIAARMPRPGSHGRFLGRDRWRLRRRRMRRRNFCRRRK